LDWVVRKWLGVGRYGIWLGIVGIYVGVVLGILSFVDMESSFHRRWRWPSTKSTVYLVVDRAKIVLPVPPQANFRPTTSGSQHFYFPAFRSLCTLGFSGINLGVLAVSFKVKRENDRLSGGADLFLGVGID
jgi:hypothetical protein